MNILTPDSLLSFDRLFNHLGLPDVPMETAEGFFSPNIDITEKGDHYTICAELAGVDKDNLNVSLEDGVLTIDASMEKTRCPKRER